MPTTFKLLHFNPRRAQRGADAAEVEISDEANSVRLWMSRKDIAKNLELVEPGDDASGLHEAEAAYFRHVMGGRD